MHTSVVIVVRVRSTLQGEMGAIGIRNEANPLLGIMHADINEVHDLVTGNNNEFRITRECSRRENLFPDYRN